MRNGKRRLNVFLKLARTVLLWLARNFGVRLSDPRTGELIGRVVILPWNAKLAIFGLTRDVRPNFLSQIRATYAMQELGFHIATEPDYPNVRSADSSSHPSKT